MSEKKFGIWNFETKRGPSENSLSVVGSGGLSTFPLHLIAEGDWSGLSRRSEGKRSAGGAGASSWRLDVPTNQWCPCRTLGPWAEPLSHLSGGRRERAFNASIG